MVTVASRTLCAITLLLALLLPVAGDAGITSVTRTGASTNCAPEIVDPFEDGSVAFCDQTYTWTGFPPEAEGELLDYVKVADADAGRSDYGLEVTVDMRGSLLLLIDPTIDVATDMPWVAARGFEKAEDINWTLDQGGPGVVYDLWVIDTVEADSTVVLGPQNNGAVSNYGVAFATDAGDLEITIKDDPDPVIVGSGLNWTQTWKVENLGSSAVDDIVVQIGATGISPDSIFVFVGNSPNSSFDQDLFRWLIPTLEEGEFATFTVVRQFGPTQTIGTDVVTTLGVIESFDGFDPDLSNNSVSESMSVLDLPDSITNVTRLGGSANCEPSLGGTLYEGAPAYCDETFFVSLLPPEVDGSPIEYVLAANADRSVPDYGLSLEFSRPGSLLLFIDPTIDVPTEMPWVETDGFKLESPTVTLDRNGTETVFTLWARDIDDVANPVTTGPQNTVGGSNYIVAYVGDIGDLALTIEGGPNPYRGGSGEPFTITYTLENLGPSPMDDVVIGFEVSGINDGVTGFIPDPSPGTTLDQGKWRVPTLDAGEVATLTSTFALGDNQAPGVDVIEIRPIIESVDGFDADPTNNVPVFRLTVLGDVIVADGFEDPGDS